MEVRDPASSLLITDPEQPLVTAPLPGPEEIEAALSSMILSASGWRKIFAADGNEESFSADVRPVDTVLAAQAALSFADALFSRADPQGRAVAVGCDSRPTGPAVADAVMRMLLAAGVEVHPLFITAAPEIMAYVKTTPELAGFVYISASHNPVGHNGIKFGFEDGAVIGGEESRRLITAYRERLRRKEAAGEVQSSAERVASADYGELLRQMPRYKGAALSRYTEFTRRVAAGREGAEEIDTVLTRLHGAARSTPTGIIADFNGSARTLSIDRRIFENLGFLFRSENDRPGEIRHCIVPEGESLEPCMQLLDAARGENPAFTLGYVPDNDGDRGNLVYFDTSLQKAAAIPAQQLFALTVLAELSYHASRGESGGKLAVVVNGPTSMRIEAIARHFGAEVFRTETGEANVVARAAELRREGYEVPILGEGSNGGNITYPATVRDPLNTLFSVLKLLLFRGGGGASHEPVSGGCPVPALFHAWCSRIGRESRYRPDFTLTDVLKTIPLYQTTSAYEPEAKMRIRTHNHGQLKARYEEVFLRRWRAESALLSERYGIVSYREVNYEGTRETAGFGADYRSGDERGGLKIIFSDAAGRDTDYIWMRGSGTEPVFRVLADSSGGDQQRERELLQWHRGMIEEADSGP
jgi:phosphomannomutase